MESIRQRTAGGVRAVVVAVAIIGMTLSACAGSTDEGGDGGDPGADTSAPAEPTPADEDRESTDNAVTLITHGSFAVDTDLLAAFEADSGIDVTILAQGDAGEMLSALTLTKENPLGDAVFGIDSTFAGKAIDAGVLAPYRSALAGNGSADYGLDHENLLTAIDFGDVCINADLDYFADNGLDLPVTLADLADPAYRDLTVVTDPATSSPGLAFLLATVAEFGADGWQDYWIDLKANGAKAVSGWTEAYTVDFSGSSGQGDRPLVLSYASSPPSEVGADGTPRTVALLDTCYRQVEYAGVLAGAENPTGAGKVIDFLLSTGFQEQIPSQMWMYPVDTATALPDDWAEHAPVATDAYSVDAETIAANRQTWLAEWADVMQG